MNYDSIVIGGGFAGLTAANVLASGGLKVIVLEAGSSNSYFCNSRISTGALHVAFQTPETKSDILYSAIMETSENTADPDLARAFVQEIPETLEWLRSMGAEFEQHPRRANPIPMFSPLREMRAGLDWETSGPNVFLGRLSTELIAKGGHIQLGSRVQEILSSEGNIIGVEYETQPGESVKIQAPNVIIADGGFQANLHLLSNYLQKNPEKICQRNARTGTGDGLTMALKLGAATTNMDTFYGHVLSRDALFNDNLWPYPQLDVLCGDGIVISTDGKRFADEGHGGICLANQIAKLVDPLGATAIIDHAIWEDAKSMDLVPPNPALIENGGTIWQANTLIELARAAKLDSQRTLETVVEYNQAIENGNTERLSIPRSINIQAAKKIDTPPFYAIPLCAGITVTSGGLKVDPHCRVLNEQGSIISGLYGIGSSVGGLEGGSKASYVGGLMKAFVFGLITGKAIIKGVSR